MNHVLYVYENPEGRIYSALSMEGDVSVEGVKVLKVFGIGEQEKLEPHYLALIRVLDGYRKAGFDLRCIVPSIDDSDTRLLKDLKIKW